MFQNAYVFFRYPSMQLSKCLNITYDKFINKKLEINRDTKNIENIKQERERERERERSAFFYKLTNYSNIFKKGSQFVWKSLALQRFSHFSTKIIRGVIRKFAKT